MRRRRLSAVVRYLWNPALSTCTKAMSPGLGGGVSKSSSKSSDGPEASLRQAQDHWIGGTPAGPEFDSIENCPGEAISLTLSSRRLVSITSFINKVSGYSGYVAEGGHLG